MQISFPRFAKADVVLGGQRIKKGAVMLAHLPAANRDSRSSTPGEASPNAGDLRRTSRSATASTAASAPSSPGWSCGRRTRRSRRRFPELRLAVEPGDLVFHDRSLVYGVESLPVYLS